MAIKYHSIGLDQHSQILQASNYAIHLLKARPDLISVLGLLVGEYDLVFLICNVSGIWKLNVANPDNYKPLIKTVIKYLNNGSSNMHDQTLERIKSDHGHILFNMATPNSMLPSLLHLSANYSFNHQTHIFRNTNAPSSQVMAVHIVKEQFLHETSKCTEGEILASIHSKGPYPAVVQMVFRQEVPNVRINSYIKYRMGLLCDGISFMSLNTPRKVLWAVYDWLEGKYYYFNYFILIIHHYFSYSCTL